MKILITIEKDKTTIEVDNGEPMEVRPKGKAVNYQTKIDERLTLPETPSTKTEPPEKPDPSKRHDFNDQGKVWIVPTDKVKTSKKTEREPAKKTQISPKCQVCGDPIVGKRKDSKYCEKESCAKEYKAKYMKRYHSQRNHKGKQYVAKDPIKHLVAPKNSSSDETPPQETPEKFNDPWNCGMCRNAGSLCTLHENMSKAGQKPPSGRFTTPGGTT